ncbi:MULTISPECIES: winged helix DNA-binding protein [Bacillus cereus group]|uniref:LexA family protein n=1 Tax=Bacillus cereus group TaxID=86661 RepID=UPI001AEDB8B5|nr:MULTISPECIES: winged helix DNA-binding protein [Bacillus cereus group]EMA6341674.1 winged helix DNA-binding protein [Bacillus cytotoxicus]QTR79140.1 winged helix DNA-binding protein [Bacillus cytotoxicus]
MILTRRQSQILTFIRDKVIENGYPPSIREIGEGIGIASSSTIHGHLLKLEEKGYIQRDHSKPRAIKILINEF